MRYRVAHTTTYRYSTPAALSLNDVCLVPRVTPYQTVFEHQFRTDPKPDAFRDRVDFFGNPWRLYAFEKPHQHLEITSTLSLDVRRTPANADQGPTEAFFQPSPFVRWTPAMEAYARASLGADVAAGAVELTRRLFGDFAYDPKATTIGTPVETFFEQRRGVCQDFAHLLVALLRSQGVAARYVSGYLNTVPPPGKEKVVGADASHAWVSAYTGQGWLDLDPTNGVVVGDGHLTVAWGRDYGDVTPLKGVVLGGGAQKLAVAVTVQAEPNGS